MLLVTSDMSNFYGKITRGYQRVVHNTKEEMILTKIEVVKKRLKQMRGLRYYTQSNRKRFLS